MTTTGTTTGMTPRELVALIEEHGEREDRLTAKLLVALRGYAEASEAVAHDLDVLADRAGRLTAERCGLVVEAAMLLHDQNETFRTKAVMSMEAYVEDVHARLAAIAGRRAGLKLAAALEDEPAPVRPLGHVQ